MPGVGYRGFYDQAIASWNGGWCNLRRNESAAKIRQEWDEVEKKDETLNEINNKAEQNNQGAKKFILKISGIK